MGGAKSDRHFGLRRLASTALGRRRMDASVVDGDHGIGADSHCSGQPAAVLRPFEKFGLPFIARWHQNFV